MEDKRKDTSDIYLRLRTHRLEAGQRIKTVGARGGSQQPECHQDQAGDAGSCTNQLTLRPARRPAFSIFKPGNTTLTPSWPHSTMPCAYATLLHVLPISLPLVLTSFRPPLDVHFLNRHSWGLSQLTSRSPNLHIYSCSREPMRNFGPSSRALCLYRLILVARM